MSKTRPAHAPHKLRYLTWGDNDLDSSTAMAFAATSVNAIDVDSTADSIFVITIPAHAGGEGGGAVTISLDRSETDGDTAAGASTIGIGTSGKALAAISTSIQNAINATTDAAVTYATSGAGTNASGQGIRGIVAAEGASDTEITLTTKKTGPDGNDCTLTHSSGANILDETTFTGGYVSRSWTDSAHPLTETDSGAIILVKEVLTANKTLTLPSAKKGLYFKIVWGITDSEPFSRVIKTATAAETFRGTIVVIAATPDTDEGDFVTDQLNSHDEIQIVDDVIQGSWIDLVSDGDHWYIADSSILNNTDGFAAAVVLQDNS